MNFMAYTRFLLCLLFSILTLSIADKQVYIVHMDRTAKPDSFSSHHDWYVSTLQSHTSSSIEDSLIYTYTHGFHGFAAYVEPHEADSLKQHDSVFAVHENEVYSLHTTRTPAFLGLDGYANFKNPVGNYKSFNEIDAASHGIIIGVVDSGVWPESKSYDDTGMPNIPTNWRGICESAPDFSSNLCNKKLIGARSFLKAYLRKSKNPKDFASPRDNNGHGTHTSTTAAGSQVPGASLFGYAKGTARGMASHARIASYRACWNGTVCEQADILEAVEQAVQDGCHILSLSLGGETVEYYNDPISISTFYAVQKGLVVSASAGNAGPKPATLSNTAPWIVTVGASTLDRTYPAHVLLGNNQQLAGVSLSNQVFGGKPLKLVYPIRSGNFCLPFPVNPTPLNGVIVICDDQGAVGDALVNSILVHLYGGAGLIQVQPKTNASGELVEDGTLVVPTVIIKNEIGEIIKQYTKNYPQASASLSYGYTTLNVKPTPTIASFSSRGPNPEVPQILKPDLVAPGVSVLAAWPSNVSPTQLPIDMRRTDFNIISGTSMSCPHVSGIIALLKVVHPDWSPSAIKSALMTTAYTLDNTNSPLKDFDGKLSIPFAHGAGHVNPPKALSPGLVYDISAEEYGKFLCSLGYPTGIVRYKFKNVTCSSRFNDPGQLNYPSFSILFANGKKVVSYSRELTNVGAAGSAYNVAVDAPSSVTVTVNPTQLVFNKVGDKQSYTVTFVSNTKPANGFASGSIVWYNSVHQVGSPIAFVWK